MHGIYGTRVYILLTVVYMSAFLSSAILVFRYLLLCIQPGWSDYLATSFALQVNIISTQVPIHHDNDAPELNYIEGWTEKPKRKTMSQFPLAPRSKTQQLELRFIDKLYSARRERLLGQLHDRVAHDSKEGPITAVCLSDTHNLQIPDVPEGDLLIHAGDLTSSGTAEELQRQLNWAGWSSA